MTDSNGLLLSEITVGMLKGTIGGIGKFNIDGIAEALNILDIEGRMIASAKIIGSYTESIMLSRAMNLYGKVDNVFTKVVTSKFIHKDIEGLASTILGSIDDRTLLSVIRTMNAAWVDVRLVTNKDSTIKVEMCSDVLKDEQLNEVMRCIIDTTPGEIDIDNCIDEFLANTAYNTAVESRKNKLNYWIVDKDYCSIGIQCLIEDTPVVKAWAADMISLTNIKLQNGRRV